MFSKCVILPFNTHTHTHTRAHTYTYTHTHTHTHTHIQRCRSIFRCVCVCVCVSSNYLTHGLSPYPYISPCLETFFTCMRMRFAPIEGSLTIVDVHDWCVSTVSLWFFLCVSTVEGIYNPPPPTHTHTYTYPTLCFVFYITSVCTLHNTIQWKVYDIDISWIVCGYNYCGFSKNICVDF